jgi:Trm5-related predicted tRNA methylase
MKKALTFLSIMPFTVNHLCSGQTTEYPPDSKPASTNIQNGQYPRVTSDLRAIFRVKGTDAQKLQIQLGKTYDMVKDDQDFWTVTTDPLVPGFHYYSLVIDGMKVSDPASEILKKAGINNVVFYQSPGTAHEWLTWRRSLYQFAQLLFK